jgi:hypothetical protein
MRSADAEFVCGALLPCARAAAIASCAAVSVSGTAAVAFGVASFETGAEAVVAVAAATG